MREYYKKCKGCAKLHIGVDIKKVSDEKRQHIQTSKGEMLIKCFVYNLVI